MASSPVSIRGARPAPFEQDSSDTIKALAINVHGASDAELEDAKQCARQSLLADPRAEHYAFFTQQLSSSERDSLIDKAAVLAKEMGNEKSGEGLKERLNAALQEMVRLKALGVPSAGTSPASTLASSLPKSPHSTTSWLHPSRSLKHRNSLTSLSSHRSMTSVMSMSDGESSPDQSILVPNPTWRKGSAITLGSVPPPRSPKPHASPTKAPSL